LERVPLVHVTMYQDGALIVVRRDALGRACQRMADRAFRTRGPSSSQVARMKSASSRPFCAPVGRPYPAAGRHIFAAAEQRISCRRTMGSFS
jgi:hypothetical protein